MPKYNIVFLAVQEIEANTKDEARELFLSGETLPEGIDVRDQAIEIEEALCL